MISCNFESGHKAYLRHVTVDTIIVENNAILLVRRAPHLLEGDKYALPGGYVDRDETLSEAAMREAREETGYQTRLLHLLHINDSPIKVHADDRQNIKFIYIAAPIDKVREPDQESTEVRWFPLDELPSPKDIAFDHQDEIRLYQRFVREQFPIPVMKRSAD